MAERKHSALTISFFFIFSVGKYGIGSYKTVLGLGNAPRTWIYWLIFRQSWSTPSSTNYWLENDWNLNMLTKKCAAIA